MNPKGVDAAQDTFAPSTSTEDPDEELPELTPSLEAFSHLPVKGYEKSWEFIKAHRDVIVPGASDALLVAAFRSQSDGKSQLAKQCVHQSLLLQYCDKLGTDGVSIFFRKYVGQLSVFFILHELTVRWLRMIAGDPRATNIFEKDVSDTYNHLVERVRISKAEESETAEQIQLVPENPQQQITFNVPDGPPPEHIELEGEGFEDVNMEDVRKALQIRWDVFQAFSPAMQKALTSQKLDEVNKVLGVMKVVDAEEIVKLLDMAGILNFSEGGIRDETGNDEEEGEEEDAAVEA